MQQLPYGMAVEIEGIVEIDGEATWPAAGNGALTVGPVEVQVTCGSADEAAAIGQRLVEGGLAACVLSLPVASVYEWDHQVQHDDEVLLLVKTRAERFAEVADVVTTMHSYDLPAITMVPMSGTAGYLDWVGRQVQRSRERAAAALAAVSLAAVEVLRRPEAGLWPAGRPVRRVAGQPRPASASRRRPRRTRPPGRRPAAPGRRRWGGRGARW